MAQKPTEKEILAEMQSIGGGNDYFAARDRLQQRFAEADRAVEKLKPAVVKTDDEAWVMEPSADQIAIEAKNFGLTNEAARESLKNKLAADARRLSSFSTDAAAEISEALKEAEAARQRAENLLAQHEAALSAVTGGIISVGNLRRKIARVKALAVDTAGELQLGKRALEYWLLRTESPSTENETGFKSLADDLVIRAALTPHIAEFIAPIEKQAGALVARIKAQAAASGMDLAKVFALLAKESAQRGESLNADFYEGLLT
jgi:hypothetical protein